MNKIINTILVTIYLLHSYSSLAAGSSESHDMKALEIFGDVLYRVKKEYIEDRDTNKLIEASINGLLSSLDPHSYYLDQETLDDLRTHMKGEFGGIGAELVIENGVAKIVSAIQNKPAFKAGLQSGDLIVAINGDLVINMTPIETLKKLKGDKGTKLTLSVRRGTEEKSYVLIRDIIQQPSVRASAHENIAYINIITFGDKTAEEVHNAFNDLKVQIGPKIQGLVLDLRNNPGGDFEQAIAVSSLFIREGEIVSTKGRNADNIVRHRAKYRDIIGDLPMITLINEGSASSSEIVAGALQDHKRSIILGTTSYGKGTVQTVIPLPGNGISGAIRLTTARYYTPSGRSIQARGIIPDIIVEQLKVDLPGGHGRAYLKESSHKNHIDRNPIAEKDHKDHSYNAEQISKINKDYQLSRALDIIKSMDILSLGSSSSKVRVKNQ